MHKKKDLGEKINKFYNYFVDKKLNNENILTLYENSVYTVYIEYIQYIHRKR